MGEYIEDRAITMSELRARAEAVAARTSGKSTGSFGSEDFGHLIGELQIYQIELELQNEELRRSQQSYEHLFEFAPVGYVTVDLCGTILHANQTAASLLDIDRSSMQCSALVLFVHSEDRKVLERHLARASSGGQRESCVVQKADLRRGPQYLRLDTIAVANNSELDAPILRIAMSNATEQRIAEQRLATLMSCLTKLGHDIAENVRQLTAVCREQLAADYVAYEPKERGSTLPSCMLTCASAPEGSDETGHGDGSFWQSVIEDPSGGLVVADALSTTHYAQCDPSVRAHGLETYIGYAVRDPARVVGALCVGFRRRHSPTINDERFLSIVATALGAQDERARAEAERLSIDTQLQRAKRFASLGTLVGGVAHDFNNVLAAVVANASVALRGLEKGSLAHRCVTDICSQGSRATEIVRQMMFCGGATGLLLETVDLADVAKEVCDAIKIAIREKTSLDCDFAPGTALARGDATQLHQVTMNLVLNAVECMTDRGGTIRLRVGTRQVDAGFDCESHVVAGPLRLGEYAYLEVADEGVGMDAATIDRAFDPFFSTKFKGRGLGLASAMGIVGAHQGAIAVRSSLGKGSVFTVLLPVCPRDQAQKRRTVDETAATLRGAGRAVLLVDDDESVRTSGERLLTYLGFRALLAKDGVEAVEVYRENQNDLCCVILDVAMPGMGGIECLRRLRSIHEDVPAVLSSGHDLRTMTRAGWNCEVAAYLPKPYDVDTLAETLARALPHN